MLARLRWPGQPQTIVAVAGLVVLEAAYAWLARLGDLKAHVIETMGIALAAGALYFIALYALEHARESRATLWVVLAGAAVFRATLFPLLPTLSTDIYRYRWDAQVQAEGWNPYVIRPDDPRVAALRDRGWAVMPAPEAPTVYPPLTELIYRATWRVLRGPVSFKLPFAAADLLVVALLAWRLRVTGGKAYQLAIYAWNPLVVVEFAASGHNDALALAGVLAAMVIIRRERGESTTAGRGAGATGWVTAAALAKLYPTALVPWCLAWAGWPRKRQGWMAAGVGGAIVAMCAWPYRSAWPGYLDVLGYFHTRWPSYNASLYAVLEWWSGSRDVAQGIGEGIVAGLALWAAARRADFLRAALLIVGAILLLTPNANSWYFTWVIPLICFLPGSAGAIPWLLLTVLQFVSYSVLVEYQANGRWHLEPLYQWLTYTPFFGMLLWGWLRRVRGNATGADGASV
jgi:alpha-1,6-mannosyltransferase